MAATGNYAPVHLCVSTEINVCSPPPRFGLGKPGIKTARALCRRERALCQLPD